MDDRPRLSRQMVYVRRIAKTTKSKPVGVPGKGASHICACGHREACDYEECNGTAIIPCNKCLMDMSLGEHMDIVSDSESVQHYATSAASAFTPPSQYHPYQRQSRQ